MSRAASDSGSTRARGKMMPVDPWIPAITVTLLAVGLVMIYSASAPRAMSTYGSSWHFAMRQLMWAGIGLCGLLLGLLINYRLWKPAVPLMMLGILVALAATLVPGIGISAGGARRWLGAGGFNIQASELAKFVCAAYIAAYLTNHGAALRRCKVVTVVRPVLVLGTVLALIVAEPDLGNAVAIAAVAGCLLFVGGIGWRFVLPLVLLAVGAFAFAVWLEPYRLTRLTSYLDPWADATGSGFQVVQSFLAFGSGGITGVGLGEGRQKLFFLPEPHTDFIYAVIGEELGLIGALGILFLFLLFAWRGLVISRSAQEPFGRYLALALTLMIVLQALINMGVAVGVLPNKGLPLPFVSYGGSALLVSLFATGVLINISKGRSGRAAAA
ncbi:MAG: putative lipid II flippase FtsW [Nitrospirota bacterium]|nr:putative lipid II flippase FtsW [Nitrospirota bacterium]